jgi:hypothetical protein
VLTIRTHRDGAAWCPPLLCGEFTILSLVCRLLSKYKSLNAGIKALISFLHNISVCALTESRERIGGYKNKNKKKV